jgi:hypothetical protein
LVKHFSELADMALHVLPAPSASEGREGGGGGVRLDLVSHTSEDWHTSGLIIAHAGVHISAELCAALAELMGVEDPTSTQLEEAWMRLRAVPAEDVTASTLKPAFARRTERQVLGPVVRTPHAE